MPRVYAIVVIIIDTLLNDTRQASFVTKHFSITAFFIGMVPHVLSEIKLFRYLNTTIGLI